MRGELTAAASRYAERKVSLGSKGNTDTGWQNRAWQLYHMVPEVRFAASYVGNAMSGATLFAGRRADDGTIERAPDDHRASQIVQQIAGGPDGQAKLLGAFGKHLTVPGEGWIVIRPNSEVLSPDAPEDGHDWRVLSTREVRQQSGKLTAEIDGNDVAIPAGDEDRLDPDAPVALRVWEPDPERAIEADSPVRSSIDLLEELLLLNSAVKAIARSRLTGRGILLVPKGTRFPTQPTQGDAEDDLIEILMQVAETAIREPESAAATVPIVLEVPAESIADFKLLTFESNFDELALKLREEAIKRFATGLEIPAEILLGLGDGNHWCTLPTVQIMTQSGWKTHDQLEPGELVLTLNHDTGLSEWQPLQHVFRWQVADESMVRIKGKRHSSLTTAAHRWPILTGRPEYQGRAWTTSGDLLADRTQEGAPARSLDRIVLAAPHADLPSEPKYSDALVELVAWFFTEGRCDLREGRASVRVDIYQSHEVNPDNVARIERALTSLFGPASEKLDKGGRYSTPESVARRAEARRLRAENPKMSLEAIGRALGVSGTMAKKYLMADAKTGDETPRWRKIPRPDSPMTMFRLNAAASAVIAEHAPDRVVRLGFVRQLTQSQLELFIDTAVRGDGHLMQGRTPLLVQKDPAMLDAFELAVILSGRSALRRSHTGEGRSANGPRERTQHVVSVSDTTTFAPQAKHLSEEAYTGTVWCPMTSNGTWLARDGGSVFFTGNSAWMLTSEAIRVGIEPKLATVAYALTQQWLRPLLQAENVDDWHRWLIWYDTAPLRVRTNRSETALQAYDRGVISSAALRRETGFNESDAPDAEEEAAREEQTDNEQPPPPRPSLPVDESTKEPSTLPASAVARGQEGLLAAADGLIWAALSSAGDKLLRTPVCPRPERAKARAMQSAALHTVWRVDPDQVEQYHLLEGAWGRVPEIARRYGLNPDCLTASFDSYARELIVAGIVHSFEVVPAVIKACADLAVAA
ncbi:hypothetical protein ACFY0A_39705 [Streptomyces sp. NPDC001698]|uniref:hypothetical protein n=1 Tax=Streptomyces sp. NPDC001698 TaxID=3364601 RepID=UPI00367E5DFC